MSVFAYGPDSLSLVRTKVFKLEPEYDPTGTDHKWNKVTLSVVGLLGPTPTTAQLPYNDAAVAGSAATAAELAVSLGLSEAAAQAAAQAAALAAVAAARAARAKPVFAPGHISPSTDQTGYLNSIKTRLMKPRQPLYYQCGNLRIQTTGVDCNLGPKPQSCEVVSMVNGYFLVHWTVTACIAECADNPTPPAVVSLKWAQSESFDKDWYSTITTRGKLIVRSDLKQSADSFRNLCVPGMLTDYRRESLDFVLNEAGTELGFTVRDKEEYRMPPYGATSATGRFTVVLSGGGAKRVGQVDLTLTGPKGGDREDLLAIATRMAMAKLESESPLGTPVYNGRFSEDLFANSVTVSLQCLLRPIRKNVDRGAIKNPGYTPYVNRNQLPLAPPVRSRLLTLLTAPFYDPCSTFGGQAVTGAAPGMQPTPDVITSSTTSETPVGPAAYSSGYGAPDIDITVADAVTDPTTSFDSVDLVDPPYDEYQIECTYSYDSGRAMLPGTGVGLTPNRALPVQVDGGQMFMDVTWYARRHLLAPVIPRFESPNSNFIGLTGSICPQGIEVGSDLESPIYAVSGHYRYGVLEPAAVSAAAPIPPFLSIVAAQASPQAAAYFNDEIVWMFQGAGPNPFSPFVATGQEPGTAVASALGAFLGVAGIPTPPDVTIPDSEEFESEPGD